MQATFPVEGICFLLPFAGTIKRLKNNETMDPLLPATGEEQCLE